jgi:DNA-binding response OmpR family regulator
MKRILVIEDDSAISMGLGVILKEELYDVQIENDGLTGYQTAIAQQFDLIVLDVMLPNKNGFEICRDLREAGNITPVLFLTSRKEEFDKIIGFQTGGDDYLTKPFSIMELKLRIKALLKRNNNSEKPIMTNDLTVKVGKFKLVPENYDVFINDSPCGLSVKEFQLLKFLIDNKGKVISRDEILDKVWGYDNYPTTRTVDNYILSLRKKIETDPANPVHLLTVPTIGYKFSEH